MSKIKIYFMNYERFQFFIVFVKSVLKKNRKAFAA